MKKLLIISFAWLLLFNIPSFLKYLFPNNLGGPIIDSIASIGTIVGIISLPVGYALYKFVIEKILLSKPLTKFCPKHYHIITKLFIYLVVTLLLIAFIGLLLCIVGGLLFVGFLILVGAR